MSSDTTTIRIPVILGPTAVGKTDIAAALARELGMDVISCDSRQVYKGMNIGTAKPSPAQNEGVRTWLVDIVDPSQFYSAFDFATQAADIIRCTHAAGRTVLICGGTGLYFQALSQGLGSQAPSDEGVRSTLRARMEVEGPETLHGELARVDPDAALRIHPNDIQRVVRALEVFTITGSPISQLRRGKTPPQDFTFNVVIPDRPRDQLHRRIESRVDAMIQDGLWDEFISLCKAGCDEKTPGMQSPGYRELFAVAKGETTLPDAVALIKYNTKRFAKRQLTWLRHQLGPGTRTLPAVDYLSIQSHFRTFLQC